MKHVLTVDLEEWYSASNFENALPRESWAWERLADAGIQYDSTVFTVLHDRYGEPDTPRAPFDIVVNGRLFREFLLSTVRRAGRNLPVARGGYLRLYPLGVTRWALRRLGAEGLSAVLYLHPWEVDPAQPSPVAHWLGVWRHRVGMKTLTRKLDRRRRDFSFGPFLDFL